MTKIIKEIELPTRIIDNIICNRCRRPCKKVLSEDTFNFEYLTVEGSWGYSSPWDDEEWSAHLCIDCARDFDAWIEENGGQIDKRDYM